MAVFFLVSRPARPLGSSHLGKRGAGRQLHPLLSSPVAAPWQAAPPAAEQPRGSSAEQRRNLQPLAAMPTARGQAEHSTGGGGQREGSRKAPVQPKK
ncbi:hypothetical protein L7F22_053058, partial [Adiantum nelumboides]|nr:hypothetical protein [Adiantum nelumboides]